MKLRFLVLTFIVFVFLSCMNNTNSKYSREVKKQVTMSLGDISIKNDSGDINITKKVDLSNDKVDINATIRSYAYEADLRKVDLVVNNNAVISREVVIESKYFELYNNYMTNVEINVSVPQNVNINKIENISGNINIKDITKMTLVNSVSGNISISNGDYISKVEATSGNINISNVREVKNIQTNSGNIDISCRNTGNIMVQSGNINLKVIDQTDDININSTSGNITVYIRPARNVILILNPKRTSGKINNNLGNKILGEDVLKGIITESNAIKKNVNLSTVSGDITIN